MTTEATTDITANFIKIGFLAACVVGLMLLLSVYQKRQNPHPEWVRKLMHLGAGAIALSLPWMFTDKWPVVVLSLLAAGGMFAVTTLTALRSNLGAVTGGVFRRTLGEICFPLGAGVIFLLADGDWLLYTIPILILTFADAAAALVGVFYGMHHYTTSDGLKTWEGSAAFFLMAFLCTLIPLLLFTEIGRVELLLIALLMAILSMLLDAVAWWGLDNFLIPVLSFLLIHEYIGLSGPVLTVQLAITVVMLVAVMFWRTRTTLNDSAILVTVIYGYLCWNLADWRWIVPPLVLLTSYNFLSPPDVAPSERPYTVQVVLSVGAAGLFWLMLVNITQIGGLFYPFMLTFAAQLAMIGSSRHLRAAKELGRMRLLARSVLLSWILLFVPYLLLRAAPRVLWLDGLAALLAIAIGVAAFTLSQGEDGYRNSPQRWLLQTLSAGLASVLGFAAIQLI
ncbi:MAG: hypothetical protein WDZ49_16340 [Litorilinea sp.]